MTIASWESWGDNPIAAFFNFTFLDTQTRNGAGNGRNTWKEVAKSIGGDHNIYVTFQKCRLITYKLQIFIIYIII